MLLLYILVSIFTPLIVNYIYFKSTYFNKKILIRKKYVTNINNTNYYNIQDVDKIVYNYVLYNIWTLYVFEKQKWDKINENEEYNVEGYGFYIPLLNITPKIVNINFKKNKFVK